MIESWIDEFLKGIEQSSLPMPISWTSRPASDARIDESLGMVLIRWRNPEAGDRLKATFSYQDEGGSPLVSLVFDRSNVLQEIEIWRGDNEPLVHVPIASNLEVPQEIREGN